MMRFNYFAEMGAFERDNQGRYRVIEGRFSEAVDALSRDILTLQGDGDYARAGRMLDENGHYRSGTAGRPGSHRSGRYSG